MHNMSFFLLYSFPPFIFIWNICKFWLFSYRFFHIRKRKMFRMLLSWYFITSLLCFFSPLYLFNITSWIFSIILELLKISSSFFCLFFYFNYLFIFIWRTINYLVCHKINGFLFIFYFCIKHFLQVIMKGNLISSLWRSLALIWFGVPQMCQNVVGLMMHGESWNVLKFLSFSEFFFEVFVKCPLECLQERKRTSVILLYLHQKNTWNAWTYPTFETLTLDFQ